MTDSDDVTALGREYDQHMRRGLTELAKLDYNATIFRQMLGEHGAVEATRRLVGAATPSYGLWRLKELGRLDMSVEMWTLLPRYEPLFDAHTRQQAEDKLRLLDVDVPTELDG